MPAPRHILLGVAAGLAVAAALARAEGWAEAASEPSRRVADIRAQHEEARALDAVPAEWGWVHFCERRVCLSRAMACDRLARAPCKTKTQE